MRPLVVLLTLVALLLIACQAPGPLSALDVQPAVGAGARVATTPASRVAELTPACWRKARQELPANPT